MVVDKLKVMVMRDVTERVSLKLGRAFQRICCSKSKLIA